MLFAVLGPLHAPQGRPQQPNLVLLALPLLQSATPGHGLGERRFFLKQIRRSRTPDKESSLRESGVYSAPVAEGQARQGAVGLALPRVGLTQFESNI